MTPEDPERRLSAALRAQAAGLGAGYSPAAAFPPAGAAGAGAAPPAGRPRPGLSAWAVLALAVLLGALTGGLAGVISAW